MKFLTSFFFLAQFALANDPSSLETAGSVSHAYFARNSLINPSALGFQKELLGWKPSLSATLGMTEAKDSSWSFSASTGPFGSFYQKDFASTKAGLALGIPLNSVLFAGVRWNHMLSPSTQDALDVGFQLRLSPYWSLGALFRNAWASPNSPQSTARLGASLYPLSKIQLSFDAESTLKSSTEPTRLISSLGYEILPGMVLRGGYQTENQWFASLVFQFDQVTSDSNWLPGSRESVLTQNLTWRAGVPAANSLFKKNEYAIEIKPSLTEGGRTGDLFNSPEPSFTELIQSLDSVANDAEIKKLSIQLGKFPLGLAAAEEVHEKIRELRSKGKQVTVWMAEASYKEYLIATAANSIRMEPESTLHLEGFKFSKYFFRKTLDKIGVEPNFIAQGIYKSAPESWMRDNSSEPAKKTTLEILGSVEKNYFSLVSKARSISQEKWKAAHLKALLDPQTALELGLIDAVESFDLYTEKNSIPAYSGFYKPRVKLPSKVAVVVADGNILQDKMGVLSLFGERALTPGEIESKIEKAVKDSRTQAVVIRINSPGGEVLASRRMAEILERAQPKIPMVASLGDIAASGGYYIAAASPVILANRFTLTGSIGVFLGKFSLAKLFEKIGLTKEVFAQGPYPNLFSEHQPWSEAEKKVALTRLNTYYASFKTWVAQKRGLTESEVEQAAQGRVWLGEQARERKLANDMGGLNSAIRLAAHLAHLREGDYEVQLIQAKSSLIPNLDFPFSQSVNVVMSELKNSNSFKYYSWQPDFAFTPFGLKD